MVFRAGEGDLRSMGKDVGKKLSVRSVGFCRMKIHINSQMPKGIARKVLKPYGQGIRFHSPL
jgi:hypothetical protein